MRAVSGGPVTQHNGWLWCALAAAFFGAATPATKLLVDDVGAVRLAGYDSGLTAGVCNRT